MLYEIRPAKITLLSWCCLNRAYHGMQPQ